MIENWLDVTPEDLMHERPETSGADSRVELLHAKRADIGGEIAYVGQLAIRQRGIFTNTIRNEQGEPIKRELGSLPRFLFLIRSL